MEMRTLIGALATFAVVGVLVTELALSAIAFSPFVETPLGAEAGLTGFALVGLGLAADASPSERRAATVAATFGVVFLLVVAVETVVRSTRPPIALFVATVVGLGFAALAFVRTA
jgi:hypothetical protein